MNFKNITQFLAAFAIIAFGASSVQAATPIAVIDLAKIVEVSLAGKDLQTKFKARRDALQKEGASYESDLRQKEKMLAALVKKGDQDGFKSKKASFENELKSKRDAILKKNIALERSKNEALAVLQGNVAKVCADLAEAKQIDVIIDKSAVVIAQKTLDMTGEVVQRLDAQLKSIPLK